MQGSTKPKHFLQLHLLVFIFGFTAILGKLISIEALPLVWYRMLLATLFIACYMGFKQINFIVNIKKLPNLLLAGTTLSLHWVAFFASIKLSNISIALITLSTGAFIGSLVEPLWYKRKIIWYEVVFGLVIVFGLYIIFKFETEYLDGILMGLLSSLFHVVFTMINGKLIQEEKPSVIGFYEMGIGTLFLSGYLFYRKSFTIEFFEISFSDIFYLFVLASVCTAYAFIALVKIMKFISPYSILLSLNLEPVYGIILALIIFGDSEQMRPTFYIGAVIILGIIVLNGVLKNRNNIKLEEQ
ncbi:DMT family transporter [Aurantibacter crassamenti]|uniref:DMT family transporter n=1 Tax=Aurantibacter crassamenti TaxID=1837375 RepID=UPI00193AADB7|nr:DMT family transporter [Aurantibacter crassamenti]MBM1106620.1 DMT family transporter [Aurantibacter crassamenti]